MRINSQLDIPDSDIDISAIRSQGPGGQNVNKVASAIHLRFDIHNSSLPEHIKQRLKRHRDYRISNEGIIVIKAQRYRSREKNLNDARERSQTLVQSALKTNKPRKRTKPTQASKEKRLEQKTRRGKTKQLRAKVPTND